VFSPAIARRQAAIEAAEAAKPRRRSKRRLRSQNAPGGNRGRSR
jgi:hypothetical protein